MFKGKRITTLVYEDWSIWLIAKECCGALGYANSRHTTKKFCKYGKLLRGIESIRLGFNPRGITIIPESDQYQQVLHFYMRQAD